MSSPQRVFPNFFPLNGGLNKELHPALLEDNELVECINFDLADGSLVKRAGVIEKNANIGLGSSPWRIVGYYYVENQNAHILAQPSVGPQKLYRSADGGVTWTEILIVGSGAAFAAEAYKSVQYGDRLIFATTAGFTRAYNGSTVDILTGSPFGITGDIVLDRLFVWDHATQVIRYCEPAQLTNWPVINTFSVGSPSTLSHDLIVALVEYKDRLVIFKQNSIWILYMTGTPVNWQIKRFVEGIGATNMYAITKAEDYIYFVGQRGVYRTNLSTVEEVSSKLDHPLMSVVDKNIFQDRGSLGYQTANYSPMRGTLDKIIFWNKKLICCINISEDPINDPKFRFFVFYTNKEIWVEWKFTGISTPWNYVAINSSRVTAGTDNQFKQGIYWGSYSGTPRFFHWKEDTFNNFVDVAAEYDCTIKTKMFTLDEYTVALKKIPYIFLRAAAGANVACEVKFNTVVSETIPAGSFNTTSVASIKRKGPGYVPHISVELRFISNGVSRYLTLYGLGFGVREPRPYLVKDTVNA